MSPDEIKKLQDENASLKGQLQSANTLIDEQNKEIERLQGAKKSAPQVKVGKETFNVLHGVRFGGSVLTAQEIADNPKAAGELVKAGSSALQKVTE